MADVETAPRKNADLPVRLASAVVMLALAVSAIVIGGTVFDTFVVIVALVAFVEFVLLVVGATANIPYRLATIIAGAVYFGLAGGVLVGAGDFLIILIIGATVFTDTFAYFTGRAIGGPKIAPSISPSKTWAGLVGGMAGAALWVVLWVVAIDGGIVGPRFDLGLSLGVGNLGADQALGGQERIEQKQRHRAQGAGANRGQGDHDAEHDAGDHGQRIQAAAAEVVVVAGVLVGKGQQLLFEQNGQGRQQQHKAQCLADDGVHRLGVGVQGAQQPQGQGRRRDAAEGQPAGDRPVDILVLLMNEDAAGFGDRRVQQIGTDRSRRVNAEPQQDWRHQGAAANPRQSDDKTGQRTCQ